MQPRILMLDEPVAGMSREETEDMARFILDARAEWGLTVLMVEHDMGMVMDLSDHVVVLNFGQVIAEGSTAQVQAHPDVIKAYLGAGDVADLRARLLARAAYAMGINVPRVFSLAWTVAGVLTAVAGIVVGSIGGISSSMGTFGLSVLVVVIVGGLGPAICRAANSRCWPSDAP